MRKFFWAIVALLVVGAVGFFGFAPGYVEGSMNKVDGKPLPKVSAEAIALHKTPAGWQCHAAGFLQRFENPQGPELRRQWRRQRQYHTARGRADAAGANMELTAPTFAMA